MSLLLAIILLAHGASMATIYTATVSGNWSNSATWGGTAPSFNVSSDQIIIPSNVTVMMDSNLTLAGASATVTVLGALNSTLPVSLTLGPLGTLAGGGVINIKSLVLQSTSIMSFTGSATLDTVTTTSTDFQLNCWMAVTKVLNLQAGTFTLAYASTFTMLNASTIILSGGTIVNSAGALLLTSSYNLLYTSVSAVGGIETGGSGLNNLTVDVSNGHSVMLTLQTTVSGTLSLVSGNLVLNGNNLWLGGDIAAPGTGAISSDPASSITLNTIPAVTGPLTFTSNSSLAFLTVNTVSGHTVNIGSNLSVLDTLILTLGKINMGNDTLNLQAGCVIEGGSSSSYVIASGTGAMVRSLTAGASNWTTFPVGTSANYAPAALKLNNGSTSGSVCVSADAGVLSQGTTGTDLSLTQAAVNTSWMIEPGFSGSIDMNIQLMWSAGMQVSGFNYDSAYISHYIGGQWNTSAASAATVSGGLYHQSLSNVTSFSPFAVFSYGTAPNAIHELTATSNFEIYPNPASQNLFIRNIAATDNVHMDVVNMMGQVISRYELTDQLNSISLSELAAGNYLLKLSGEKINEVKPFIKM